MRLRSILPIFLLFFTPNPSISAECEYRLNRNVYRCIMKKAFVFSEDSVLEIEGEHLPGYNDSDVKVVAVFSSVLHYLQPTIFDKFSNTEEFRIQNVELWGILPNALTNCNELTMFSIEDPELLTIPVELFKNCPKLKELTLKAGLSALPNDAFYGIGTSLQNLDLSGNQITSVTEDYFKGLIRLKILNLAENKLNELSSSAFDDLSALIELNLMGNSLLNVPEVLFARLRNLEILDLRINLIEELKDGWFMYLTNLQTLDLSRNRIKDLPENIFVPLQSLKFLYLDENSLEILHPISFGYHQHMAVLTIDHNNLQSIHINFFDSFPNLEYFHAVGNDCIHGFVNGHGNPIDFDDSAVKLLLRRCHYAYNPSDRLIDNKYINLVWIVLASTAVVSLVFYYVIYFCARKRFGKWKNKFDLV